MPDAGGLEGAPQDLVATGTHEDNKAGMSEALKES